MEIFILIILILLNGFFALSEIALVSSKPSRLEQMRINGSKGAAVALRLLQNSKNFLSAVQVGITLIGILTGAYGGITVADKVAPVFRYFDLTRPFANDIALAVTVVVITFFSIVIGELVPKTIALSNPEAIAKRIAPVIQYFSRIFFPFVKLLSGSTSLINKILNIQQKSEQVTEAELRQMIKIASSEGVIEKEQNLLHERVFYFADKKAKHIMKHRTDVEWVDINKPNDSIKEQILITHRSKIICCDGNLDHFLGILYVKDYLGAVSRGESINIKDLLIQPLIVPENAEAQKVLNLFRQNSVHFCVVVNEYGGFEGIITLRDIMENIIGDIPDEGEPYEPDLFVRDDNSVLINGDAPVETLAEIIEPFEIDFEKIDYSTVAGFVFNYIDKIPKVGDKFTYAGYEFEIVDIDGNRIDKILVKKIMV
jgi:putative hemolysin